MRVGTEAGDMTVAEERRVKGEWKAGNCWKGCLWRATTGDMASWA